MRNLKSTLIIAVVAIIGITALVSCEKETEIATTSETVYSTKAAGQTGISILAIRRGEKINTEEQYDCLTNPSRTCWLWFKDFRKKEAGYTYSYSTVVSPTLINVDVDLSYATSDEKSWWGDRLQDGQLIITGDVLIEDGQFLKDLSFSQPITILEQVTDVDEIGQDLISFDLKYTIK
jgi:hypothetical protein